MTKKIITIIVILLAVFALLLGGIWLIGRRQDSKAGKTPSTFKEFLGLSVKKAPADIDGGTTTSIFTNVDDGKGSINGLGQDNNSGLDSSALPADDTVQSSQFTGNGLSPADNSGLAPDSGFGVGGNIGADGDINGSSNGIGLGADGGSGSSDVGGTGGSAVGSGNSGVTAPVCTTADVTISFNEDEIAELNKLQTRYNAIAGHLAGTDEIASEAALYGDYKLEEAKLAEMQNFCQTTAPLINDPVMQRRVPTPFWNNGTDKGTPFSTPVGSGPNARINVILERLLRINLW
jgi:hypothetical protein